METIAAFSESLVAIVAAFQRDAQSAHPWIEALVLSTFATVNSIRIFAYVPQIVKVARDRNGASAVSSTTWGLFLASHIATILYAVFVLGDAVMALIFLGNALACVAILGLTAWCRLHHRRCAAGPAPLPAAQSRTGRGAQGIR
jgi:hypothetical protein